MKRAVLLGICALALSGCSQVSALAPVGGDALRTVSIAVNNILQENDIEVMVVPVCVQQAKTATCSGTTADGREIAASADLTMPITMTLSVAGQQLYSGSAQDIIDKAAQK